MVNKIHPQNISESVRTGEQVASGSPLATRIESKISTKFHRQNQRFFFSLMCLPPDPALVGDNWRAMWLERLQNTPLFQDNWLQHQRRDAVPSRMGPHARP
jgi:predicted acyl esterase